MEVLPNVHLLGLVTVTFTLVYRKRALIPIYLYVVLEGLFSGFNFWWLPYTYIWTILWAIVMILPRNIPNKISYIVYSAVCALHGFAFGTLYAPAQALMFGLTLKQTVAWIIAGVPYDLIHGISNLGLGLLVVPLKELLIMLSKNTTVHTKK
jgi:energy-coupling factor transport system substrate-specific component